MVVEAAYGDDGSALTLLGGLASAVGESGETLGDDDATVPKKAIQAALVRLVTMFGGGAESDTLVVE